MNTTEIEINGKRYNINVDKAIQDGYLEPYSYKIGDRFTIRLGPKNNCYILVRCNPNEVVLANLETGSNWNEPEKVWDDGAITEEEFKRISVGRTFTKIPKSD